MPKPWERQPNETVRAFECFTVYLELGKGRTVPAAYRQETGKTEASQPSGTWNGWHSHYNWQERAIAYDDHMAQERQRQREEIAGEEFKKELEAYRKIHYRAGMNGMQIATALKEVIRTFTDSDKMVINSLEDLERAARVVRALESPSSEALALALGVKELLKGNAND